MGCQQRNCGVKGYIPGELELEVYLDAIFLTLIGYTIYFGSAWKLLTGHMHQDNIRDEDIKRLKHRTVIADISREKIQQTS